MNTNECNEYLNEKTTQRYAIVNQVAKEKYPSKSEIKIAVNLWIFGHFEFIKQRVPLP